MGERYPTMSTAGVLDYRTNLETLHFLQLKACRHQKNDPFYKWNKKSVRPQKSEVETADFVVALSVILFAPKEGSERGRP